MRMLRPLRTLNGRTVQLKAKHTDPYYATPEHHAWRRTVLRKAHYQCEWVEQGIRCRAHSGTGKLYADHILERQDYPDLELDPNNGQCLCYKHHSIKTVNERAKRMGLSSGDD